MSEKEVSLPHMRFLADKRQFAGMLMVTGFCAVIQPLFGLGAGTTTTTADAPLPFAIVFGGYCVLVTGIFAVVVGYMELIHDWGNRFLTIGAASVAQLAYIAYFGNMIFIGRVARMGGSFIGASADAYNQTATDNKFVAAMGILSVLAYGFTLIGSIAFMEFALYAYQVGKPQDRDGNYYRGRSWFYSMQLFIAGLTQFLLGCYCTARFGSDLSEQGPVVVAVYFVLYPPMTLVVGLFQMINGVWGFLRSRDYLVFGPNDSSYHLSLGFLWLLQLLLQVIVQSFSVGMVAAGFAPTVAAFAFAQSFMSGYLDYKARTLPATLEPSYYSVTQQPVEEAKKDVEGQHDEPADA